MNQEQILKLEESIQKMRDKKSRIYFIVQDTKGNAKASIRYIYEMAMSLKNNGFNAIILHETPEYFGVTDWLGEEYMTNLDHKSIEGTNLEISPEDLIVIPEIYGFIMECLFFPLKIAFKESLLYSPTSFASRLTKFSEYQKPCSCNARTIGRNSEMMPIFFAFKSVPSVPTTRSP